MRDRVRVPTSTPAHARPEVPRALFRPFPAGEDPARPEVSPRRAQQLLRPPPRALRPRYVRITREGDAEEREADRAAELIVDGPDSPERTAAEERLAAFPARIHDDPRAHSIAAVLGARAVAIDRDVYFAAGELNRSTRDGQRLFVHEMWHAAGPVRAEPSIRRKVMGDVLKQSIGPIFAHALTNDELRAQAALVVSALEALPPGSSADRRVLEMNLHVLEEESELRGIDLPALTAHALRDMMTPLLTDVHKAADDFKAAAATKYGMYNTRFDQEPFDDVLSWGVDQLTWVVDALQQASSKIEMGGTGGPNSGQLLRDAATRCVAAFFGLQAFRVFLAYVQTSASLLSQVPGTSLEDIVVRLFHVRDQLKPTMAALQTLDATRVEQIAQSFPALATSLKDEFDKWIQLVKEGHERYVAFMKFFAIYQLAWGIYGGYQAFAAGGGPWITMSASAGEIGIGAGGAGTMTWGSVAVSVEWLEMIKQLSQIGAFGMGIATPALAGATMAGGTPAAAMPTVMLRSTPSGSVTPGKGPSSGKAQSYGDSRNKHTKVADHSAAELDAAIKDPSKAPPDLQYLKPNVGNAGYGSQLGKEAADKYGDLVKDALENGKWTGTTRVDHTASFEVGVDIISGTLTKNYRMYYSTVYGGWHIFPVL